MEIRDTKKIKTLDTGASGFERLTGKIQNSTTSLLTEDMKDKITQILSYASYQKAKYSYFEEKQKV